MELQWWRVCNQGATPFSLKEAVAKEIGKIKQSSATVYAAGDRDRTRDGQPVEDLNIEHANM